MRINTLIKKERERLTTQLVYKTALLERYAVHGYITEKNINKNKYKYLQFRNADGKLISVFMNKKNLQIYEDMIRRRKKTEKRINHIEDSLALVGGAVDLNTQKMQNVRLPERRGGLRLLNHAVGISERYHALYQILPDTDGDGYSIYAKYDKKDYCIPMTYTNERLIGKIREYVYDAGVSIDNAILESRKGKERPVSVIHSSTRSQIQYVARRNGDCFDIGFNYDGKERHLLYRCQSDRAFLADEFYKMDISKMIEDYVDNYELDKITRRITK